MHWFIILMIVSVIIVIIIVVMTNIHSLYYRGPNILLPKLNINHHYQENHKY